MKSKDHTNLEDKDLVNKLLNGSWFRGYEDEGFVPTRKGEVFTPTRKELLVLFKDWYKNYQVLNYYNSRCVSLKICRVLDDISDRFHLIAEFLPDEVLEAVCKQMDEEDLKLQEEELKLREKELPQIPTDWRDEWEAIEEKECGKRHQNASQERLF